MNGYDPDQCPTCGGSGYAAIRAEKDAARAEWDRRLARSYFVYRAYDDEGILLYVGMTKMPAERWQTHKRESGWAQYAASFGMNGPFLRETAKELERDAIRTEHPLWNISGRSRGGARPEVERYVAQRQAAS